MFHFLFLKRKVAPNGTDEPASELENEIRSFLLLVLQLLLAPSLR